MQNSTIVFQFHWISLDVCQETSKADVRDYTFNIYRWCAYKGNRLVGWNENVSVDLDLIKECYLVVGNMVIRVLGYTWLVGCDPAPNWWNGMKFRAGSKFHSVRFVRRLRKWCRGRLMVGAEKGNWIVDVWNRLEMQSNWIVHSSVDFIFFLPPPSNPTSSRISDILQFCSISSNFFSRLRSLKIDGYFAFIWFALEVMLLIHFKVAALGLKAAAQRT